VELERWLEAVALWGSYMCGGWQQKEGKVLQRVVVARWQEASCVINRLHQSTSCGMHYQHSPIVVVNIEVGDGRLPAHGEMSAG
jgi:hypothetical protein